MLVLCLFFWCLFPLLDCRFETARIVCWFCSPLNSQIVALCMRHSSYLALLLKEWIRAQKTVTFFLLLFTNLLVFLQLSMVLLPEDRISGKELLLPLKLLTRWVTPRCRSISVLFKLFPPGTVRKYILHGWPNIHIYTYLTETKDIQTYVLLLCMMHSDIFILFHKKCGPIN